jgi:hypothetical protein
MKPKTSPLAARLLTAALLLVILFAAALPAAAQNDNDEAQATVTTEVVVQPTPPDPTNRPIIVLDSYRLAGEEMIGAMQAVNLIVRVTNDGTAMAFNLVATFTSEDFVVRATGGVAALREVDPGENHRIEQPLTANYSIIGKTFATLVMNVTYNDQYGAIYTQTFNLTVPVRTGPAGPTRTPTLTPTVVPALRPQLVVTAYTADVDPLKPGAQFGLDVTVANEGNSKAQRVTMILGGGSSSSASPGQTGGTPDASGATGGTSGTSGGVAGGSGDFANFAPVSSSNVQYLGDLSVGDTLSAHLTLIVNATTNPGAYPLKLSFTYLSENNLSYTDEQVITLLVLSPPLVDVSFYRDPGMLMSGQPNQLPIQITNLGRKSTILGTLRVLPPEGVAGVQIENGSTLVGALDVGGYFTLDAMVTFPTAGSYELPVAIDFTDDFNNPQVITRTLSVEVIELPTPDPNEMSSGGMEGGEMPMPSSETFWQKALRFLRGLVGLDSGAPSGNGPMPGEMPPGEEFPGGGGGSSEAPAIVPSGGGKGG